VLVCTRNAPALPYTNPATVNFFVGDLLGRRKNIWLAMGFVLIGATLQTSAYNVPHLIVGRIITGFGTGIKTSTVPM
jgi:MFS family permease